MVAEATTVLIMAAGTGGHVFPALSIAQKLQAQGVRTEWMGTQQGMEHRLLEGSGIAFHPVSAKGLKGKGLRRILLAPLMLVVALIQSMRVIIRVKPDCVLGMGGFVSGPGGLAAKLLGKPLLIHEQNAVAGFTNKMLAKIADKVFEAFPGTFKAHKKVVYTGNPVRKEIAELAARSPRAAANTDKVHLLVLGGSQGALAINEVLPRLMAEWPEETRPALLHQSGEKTLEQTKAGYQSYEVELSAEIKLVPFISDMAGSYEWADLVVCRSGASTVCELAAVGSPSILVPYPHHRDQQQLHNANWLVNAGAAILLEQKELSVKTLSNLLAGLVHNRDKLQQMSQAASAVAVCNADELVASGCMELAHA